MVKFTFLALAAAVAAASAATPVVKKTIKLGNRKLRRGDAGTEALLKKARPFKKGNAAKKTAARRLDGEEEEFEIDGTYSLQFSECIDVKTYDEDLFDEDIVDYVKSGQIVSAKSYVLFHVCTDDTCYLDAEDDLYLVDLPTYLTNVATYHANKRTDYCEQCNEFEDYCNPEEEEEGDGDGEEEEEEGEEEEDNEEEDEDRRKRKLAKRKAKKKVNRKAITRKLADREYIDCDKCFSYECYEDEDEMDDGQQRKDDLDNEVSEWIAGLAECQQSGQMLGDLNLYTGVMCSPYGDGVELAVFANEDCTWYTNQASFQDVYSPYDDEDNQYSVNYLTYAENFIKAAFSEVTPCLQKEYANPDEEEDENENDDEEQQYEATEYCQGVMEEDAVSWSNCEADEEEEEEEEDQNMYYYDWFTYDMKEADEINKVCVTLNALDSADYSHVYDEESSGTWYKRNKKGAIVFDSDYKEGLSGGAIFGILVLILGVVGAAGFVLSKGKKAKVETDYQGGEMS